MTLAIPLLPPHSSDVSYFVMMSWCPSVEDRHSPPFFKANVLCSFLRAALRHFTSFSLRVVKFPSRTGSVCSKLGISGPECILKQPICLYSVEEIEIIKKHKSITAIKRGNIRTTFGKYSGIFGNGNFSMGYQLVMEVILNSSKICLGVCHYPEETTKCYFGDDNPE